MLEPNSHISRPLPLKLFSYRVHGVESVDSFVYLGSLRKSEDNSRPDMKCRISLAASVMSSLGRIWRDKILQLSTKIRLYQALVMSVLLYAAETWTLLSCDEKTLEAFHMKCQRQILHIHWSQHVINAEISARTGLPPVMDFIRRRLSVFGHIARLTRDSSTQRRTLPSWPSIRSFTWQGLETLSWPSSRALDRPTPQRHWICSCQPLETGHLTGPWWSDATA